MFNKGIYKTTLTSDVADKLFSNITSENVNRLDSSFLATLRALLRKRLPQDETVKLACCEVHVTYQQMTEASSNQCMNWFLPDDIRLSQTYGHNIYIVYATGANAGDKMLDIVKAYAGNGNLHMSNYTRRDDLHVFYARKAKSLFYTDDTQRNTVIFTSKMELKHFHVLQMLIPKYLPLLFDNSPLTETETLLLKSTGNKSAVEYETLIEDFAKEFDIRAEIIRTRLTGFESVHERIHADELRRKISDQQKDYEHHLFMMRSVAETIQEYQYTLAGLECAIGKQSEDSELMEYFMCNKNLSLMRVIGTRLEFVAHGYVDIYDPEAFEQYVGNHNGYMYSGLNPAITKPEMEMLYRALFGECKYKLRICAAFAADIKTGLVGMSHYSFPTESKTYFPNPHIQHFGCIGDYAGRFMEYMQKRDYVGGIDQAIVSARNFNFYDSAVMGNFASSFSSTTIKCIEKSDGTILTPLAAIKELEGGASCQDQ